jgi:CubicO group peptidase (beta-lactamase class C family)
MRIASWALVLALMVASMPNLARADESSRAALPRSAPEKQGVSSRALLAFVEAADRQVGGLHSFVLVRHGHVVAQGFWAPYERDVVHEVYSVTKSFTSTGVGLAIAEGKLSLASPVLDFFPEHEPASPSAQLRAMRVQDLLTMSTGHDDSAVQALDQGLSKPSVERFLAQPVAFEPGTHFVYNTPASYVLSAIVQKVTGLSLRDYLAPRLFEPLGIELPPWAASADGVTVGGFGLGLRTEDIAKFGELYLRKGVWHGQQLVPAEWIAAATTRQVSTGPDARGDWALGYGFQFWRSRHGYRADGAFGQFCLVLPEYDAVIAITGGTDDMQATLKLVWDKLLPALEPAALAPDEVGARKLQERSSKLMLPPLASGLTPSHPERISGKHYVFQEKDGSQTDVSLEWLGPDQPATLTLKRGGQEQRIRCRSGAWSKGRAAWREEQEGPIAASCAWMSNDTLALRLRPYERSWVVEVSLSFEPKRLRIRESRKHGFGPRGPFERVGLER